MKVASISVNNGARVATKKTLKPPKKRALGLIVDINPIH